MVTRSNSVTDLVAEYDDLTAEGKAPDREEFCARYPQYPSLRERLLELQKLRGDLSRLFGPPATDEVAARDGPGMPEVPGFELHRKLGRGGMGTVYLAEQQSPRRICALKVMDRAMPAALDRFRREADLAARLSHPGIATVYSFGVFGEQAYLATEVVHGFSLQELLRTADVVSPSNSAEWFMEAVQRVSEGFSPTGPPSTMPPVDVMTALAVQIADALAHAHQRGVIHRDVKPSNIIVGLDGMAKLIDFGIAVTAEETDDRVTRTGTFIGSHGYAAPEQLRGAHNEVGPWTDTYALGATLFETLTQQTPFETVTFADRLTLVDAQPVHGPRHYNRKVPRALDRLVQKALHPEPSLRFHDGEEIAEALRECPTRPSLLPGLPVHQLRRLVPRSAAGWVALVAVFVALFSGYQALETKDEMDKMRAGYRTERWRLSLARLDQVLNLSNNKEAQQKCLVDDPSGMVPVPEKSGLWVELEIENELVTDATLLPGAYNIGSRARRCIVEAIRKMRIEDVGTAEPITLQFEIEIGSPD